MKLGRLLSASITFVAIGCAAPAAEPPDHIVIVIEENHSYQQVIGNLTAPYMNSLAQNGALFNSMYGITHPSQPNYLQFFSGDNQGVTSNNVPSNYPFTTPNLGAALFAAGFTFAGYSEDLPGVGSDVAQSGAYYRKHNPWVNWQKDPPGTNQLPSTTNLPFTMFPGDFTQLPAVSIVVPNQLHDMHDGTIQQADDWLSQYIGPYADWAMLNNSLLIITWDEDNSAAFNRIPTIFYGPMARTGGVNSTWTLHNLLRTVEQRYGTTHAGAAAQVRPMIGCFTDDPEIVISRFIQGAAGYNQAVDTYIEAGIPTATHGADGVIVVDGSPLSQGLICFKGLVGANAGQVPPNSLIASAKLLIMTGNVSGDLSANNIALHRMLVDWDATATWDSLAAGVSTDGIEAATSPGFTLLPNQQNNWAIFDATNAVQSWTDNPSSNFGWLLQPLGSDGWRWISSEGTTSLRPALEVTWYACSGDLNNDHLVDLEDLAITLSNYGSSAAGLRYMDGDLNGDGLVDFSDLARHLSLYGALCP